MRAFITKLTPASAKASAQPRPSPLLDAHTNAVLPLIPKSIVTSFVQLLSRRPCLALNFQGEKHDLPLFDSPPEAGIPPLPQQSSSQSGRFHEIVSKYWPLMGRINQFSPAIIAICLRYFKSELTMAVGSPEEASVGAPAFHIWCSRQPTYVYQ